MKKEFLVQISILLILLNSVTTDVQSQTPTDIRYSFDLDLKDEFTWKVTKYLDDGIKVSTESDVLGRVTDNAEIKLSVIQDPATVNVYEEEDNSYILELFKISIGKNQISKPVNIGVAEYLVFPVSATFDNADEKHYINYFFKTVLGGKVIANGNNFEVTIENYANYTMHVTPIDIETWILVYNSDTGVLQSMSLEGTADGSNIDFSIDKTKKVEKGFLDFQIFNFFTFSALMLVILIKRYKLN